MDTKKEDQILWVFGAIERLCNLGMLGGFKYHVSDPDKFLEIDDRRQTLFLSDELMGQLVSIVCRRECGLTEPHKIGAVIHLVKTFRDEREKLVKFALEEVVSRDS